MKQTQTLRTRLLPKATSRISSRDWMVSSMVRGELRHARPHHDHPCTKQKIEGVMLYDRSMIAVSTTEVRGLKDALKVLGKLEPGLRKEIGKDFTKIVAGVVKDAKSLVPKKAPLSGMARKWEARSGYQMLPWDERYRQKIKAVVNSRAIKEFKGATVNVGTFFIRYLSPIGGDTFDMGSGGSLGANLTARYGEPSRVVWKAWAKHEVDVNTQMDELVKRVMDGATKALRASK